MQLFDKNIKDTFYDLTSSGFETDEYDSLRKVVMINSFFIVGMITFFFFALIHTFITHKYIISLIDIAACSIFAFSYFDLKRNKDINRASIIGLLSLILFMFFFAYINHNNGLGLIWTIFVPIFAISLFGSKTGFFISLVYYLFLFLFLLYGALYWNDASWNLVSLFRLVIASFVLVITVFMTENSFEKISQQLKKLTNTDALTHIHNRRKIDEIIKEKLYNLRRYKTKFCVAIIDIDDFKKVNDKYGHAKGDEVLIDFAKILLDSSRQTDAVGRWGGEEFMFIMQNTNLEYAVAHMNKIKEKISSHNFNTPDAITCSIGVCEASDLIDNEDKLFACADSALYFSKHNGKNQVSFHKAD